MTRDEIVTALRCCASIDGSGCGICPSEELDGKEIYCGDALKLSAADLIENQQNHIRALLQANDALRERQRWIPVTERLPENGERVLAYCKDRVIHDVKWSWPQNAWFDKVTGHEYFESFATHWMLLPEAPEVE